MSEHCKFDHFFGHFVTFENWLFFGVDPLSEAAAVYRKCSTDGAQKWVLPRA